MPKTKPTITKYTTLQYRDGSTVKVPVEINGTLKLNFIHVSFFLCDKDNTVYKITYDDTYSNCCKYELAIKKVGDEHFVGRLLHGMGETLVGLEVLAYEHCINASKGRCWGDYTYLTSYNSQKNLLDYKQEHQEFGIPGFNGTAIDPVEPEYPDLFDSTVKTRFCFDSSD